jgi:hypothetical protein
LHELHGALMPKRLRMTAADYLAIAISPALIMLLVGSLVFFLIEVMYAGQYQARLNYVFALFVFATVLVARISIEMGSERAAMYSIPLAIATFVVLQKFIEYPSVLSPLFNLLLITVVWWCAHKLTWDCTLIDDSQDASGEGLMQVVGVDDPGDVDEAAAKPANQLVSDDARPGFWQRLLSVEKGPHPPGLWVLYFSLAALPIFGVGQGFISTSDTGSRRYTFILLATYVAAGLLLLVTTSFLGFRRYLRQRDIEMPSPMAATWIGVGGVLTAIVLLVTMLLPRPNAEFAFAQSPWQATSPEGLTSSRHGRGNDGAREGETSSESVITDDENIPQGEATREPSSNNSSDQASSEQTSSEESTSDGSQSNQSKQSDQPDRTSQDNTAPDDRQRGDDSGQSESADTSAQSSNPNEPGDEQASRDQNPSQSSDNSSLSNSSDESTPSEETSSTSANQQPGSPIPEHSASPPASPAKVLQSMVSGLANVLKWLFYLALALLAMYLLWKYRQELIAAAREMLRDLRAWLARLFGGEANDPESVSVDTKQVPKPRKSFREFQNPFASDRHRAMAPDELVRYTFEALEAWSADHGKPRRADQTPVEFADVATIGNKDMHRDARILAMLYSRIAYGAARVTAHQASGLTGIWTHMQKAEMVELVR